MRNSGERQRSYGSNKKRSPEQRKGIFTSKYNEKDKPNVSPYLNSNLDYSLNNSKEGFKRTTSANINQAYRNTHSNSLHLNHPSRQSGSPIKHQSNIQFVPIQQYGHPKPDIIIHPPNHSPPRHYNSRVVNTTIHQPIEIRKQIIPQHIYNHIPVNLGSSYNSVVHNDQAYELLLKQYENLYNRLQEELNRNKGEMTTEGQRRRYSLNIQILHDKLAVIYEEYVNMLIKNYKVSAKNRLHAIFQNASNQISQSTFIQESNY